MKRKFSLREQILMVVLALLLLICVYYILVERPCRTRFFPHPSVRAKRKAG